MYQHKSLCTALVRVSNPTVLIISQSLKIGPFAPNFKIFLISFQKATGAIAPVDLCQRGPCYVSSKS